MEHQHKLTRSTHTHTERTPALTTQTLNVFDSPSPPHIREHTETPTEFPNSAEGCTANDVVFVHERPDFVGGFLQVVVAKHRATKLFVSSRYTHDPAAPADSKPACIGIGDVECF